MMKAAGGVGNSSRGSIGGGGSCTIGGRAGGRAGWSGMDGGGVMHEKSVQAAGFRYHACTGAQQQLFAEGG